MTSFEHELEVRFRDCDSMGHVNNAVYLTYLEQARFAHWQRLTGVRASRATSSSRGSSAITGRRPPWATA